MPKSPFETNKNQGGSRSGGSARKKAGFRKRVDDAPTWDSVDATLVHAIVALSTTQGASPTFGYTRDGSSLTLALYHEGDRMIDYLSGAEEVLAYWGWLSGEYFNVPDDELASYAIGPRK